VSVLHPEGLKRFDIRVASTHVREGELRHCNHLDDIGLEYILCFFKINLGKLLAHVLFRRIIDEYVDFAESV
jgi:hypothetical protein